MAIMPLSQNYANYLSNPKTFGNAYSNSADKTNASSLLDSVTLSNKPLSVAEELCAMMPGFDFSVVNIDMKTSEKMSPTNLKSPLMGFALGLGYGKQSITIPANVLKKMETNPEYKAQKMKDISFAYAGLAKPHMQTPGSKTISSGITITEDNVYAWRVSGPDGSVQPDQKKKKDKTDFSLHNIQGETDYESPTFEYKLDITSGKIKMVKA